MKPLVVRTLKALGVRFGVWTVITYGFLFLVVEVKPLLAEPFLDLTWKQVGNVPLAHAWPLLAERITVDWVLVVIMLVLAGRVCVRLGHKAVSGLVMWLYPVQSKCDALNK